MAYSFSHEIPTLPLVAKSCFADEPFRPSVSARTYTRCSCWVCCGSSVTS
ncbi:MAG: hypothetical protein MEEGG_01903 [Eggerthella lenta]